MDELVTPPFAFNTTYEMTASPATWQWPESAPPPTPDQLASLLAEARAEDVRFAQAVAAMEKKKKETKTKGINHGTVVEEEFGDEDIDGAPPGTFSATVAPTVTPATTGATRVAEPTPFLANLRARFEEAMNIAKELDTHEYHRPEDVRIDPEDVTGAAVDEDEVPSAL
jgi:hypothetical protein